MSLTGWAGQYKQHHERVYFSNQVSFSLPTTSQGVVLVCLFSQLTPGQKGKVAYVYAPESNKLHKLMAMGILPGAPVSLVQNFPSYVFQIRQTQFAVDKEIADAIYIRLAEGEVSSQTWEALPHGRGWGRGRLARRFGLQRSKRR